MRLLAAGTHCVALPRASAMGVSTADFDHPIAGVSGRATRNDARSRFNQLKGYKRRFIPPESRSVVMRIHSRQYSAKSSMLFPATRPARS
jgi:hypothetical protein